MTSTVFQNIHPRGGTNYMTLDDYFSKKQFFNIHTFMFSQSFIRTIKCRGVTPAYLYFKFSFTSSGKLL